MKTFLRPFLFVAALLFGGSSLALAQQVSTGIIEGYQPQAGTLTIRSDQTKGLITFFGVNKSNIYTTDGKVASIAELPLGSKVTVHFAEKDKQWFVSRVVLPPAAPMPKGLPVNAEPPNSRAGAKANDGDITTNADATKTKVERLRRE